MNISMLTLSLAVACSLSACTTSAREPESRPDLVAIADEEAAAETVERLIEPTAEMLAAALSDDPVKMQQAVALSGCQLPSPCPASYGSCSSWSAPAQCNYSCSSSPLCQCPFPEHPDDPPCEPNPYILQGIETYNSFRVCFNSAGQSCTSWKRTFHSYCGC